MMYQKVRDTLSSRILTVAIIVLILLISGVSYLRQQHLLKVCTSTASATVYKVELKSRYNRRSHSRRYSTYLYYVFTDSKGKVHQGKDYVSGMCPEYENKNVEVKYNLNKPKENYLTVANHNYSKIQLYFIGLLPFALLFGYSKRKRRLKIKQAVNEWESDMKDDWKL